MVPMQRDSYPVAVTQAPLFCEFDVLGKMLAELMAQTDQLKIKLEPFRVQTPPTMRNEKNPDAPGGPHSPAMNRIIDLQSSVALIIDTQAEIIRSLDI